MRRLPLEQLLALVASIAVVGCTGPGAYDPMDPTEDPTEPMPYEPPSEDDFVPTPTTAGDEESTFSHPAGLGPTVTSPREALERMQEQGPPAFASRVHSCRKVRFRTIGRVLASRGVNLDADGELSAGRMYRSSDQSLGAPNYGARIPETTSLTVASASRLFDILVQAAPEIIANLPSREECRIGERGAALFDEDGSCNADGLTCLLGVPATVAHVGLCDDTVSRADNLEEGQRLAVATLLAAELTCE
ncbi:MAG: hypothetical protein H6720_22235 [Sandaracinus sp.]|nr:hypothetical protein [Sandaracinus sp.]